MGNKKKSPALSSSWVRIVKYKGRQVVFWRGYNNAHKAFHAVVKFNPAEWIENSKVIEAEMCFLLTEYMSDQTFSNFASVKTIKEQLVPLTANPKFTAQCRGEESRIIVPRVNGSQVIQLTK